MDIIFEKIKYSNLMAVGQNPIEIELNTHAKTLITGGNGTAKSTLIEALNFALYGSPYRDIKKDQLINFVNKAKMRVDLWLSVGSQKVHIIRGIKPNIFEIYVDGELVPTDASVREYQKRLESIIELSEIIFKQMVVLGTATFKPFLKLTTAERKATVEQIIGLTIISEMDKWNKELIRELNQSIKISEMKISHLETQIKSNMDFIKKQKADKTENKQRYKQTIEAINSKISSDSAEMEMSNLEMEDVKFEVPFAENIEKNSELLNKINAYIVEYKTKHKQASELLSLYDKGGNCPVCHQDVQNADKEPVIKSIGEYKETLRKLVERRKNVTDEMAENNKIKSEYEAIKARVDSYMVQIAQANAKIKELYAEIERIESMDSSNEYTEKIKELKKELNDTLEANTKNLSEKYTRGIVSELFKEDGIKSVIISKYIPYFNARVRHYLEIMEADYEFSIDETFNEVIRSRGREKFSYNSFSQGEKSRIDIALLFTWRDVLEQVSGTRISLLIMDEVFDSALDHTGIEAIYTILDTMKHVNSYIISHRDQDVNMYDRVIKTSKHGPFSSIEVLDLEAKVELPEGV